MCCECDRVQTLDTYLLRVRVSESVAALIWFCASTWVMSSALVAPMDTTQSPTPTPAWAALPPGVSWREREREGGERGETGESTAHGHSTMYLHIQGDEAR